MFEQTFSLEKLSEFVGRGAILQDMRDRLDDDRFHFIFFSGSYGVGKTRLLQRLLEMARKELKYDGAPTQLIDLYHFRHHSPEGLARVIYSCFKETDNLVYFKSYVTAQRKLDEARAAGDSKVVREQLQKLLDSCVEGLRMMSVEQGVLLLFDTAEQFVYPTGSRFAPAWDWVKSWITDLPRGAVIFAGRVEAEPLFQADGPQPDRVPLEFFSPEESHDYLLATAQRWSHEMGVEVSFAEEDAQRLHSLSQGRPILLALFLELRIRNPQAFRGWSKLETKTFEQQIINDLLSLPELGETLKAAGRAPKGINADILAEIRGIKPREAKVALENLKRMSFAKTFPDDERVFLHDEMYALLNKYVYTDASDAADGQAAAQAIYAYYKQAIVQKDQNLRDIFASLTREVDFNPPAAEGEDYIPRIRSLETTRHQLKTEFLFYRLRHAIAKGTLKPHEDDPIQAGLKNYYRFGHEAATSGNDEILIPLQIELTKFWLDLEAGNFWKPMIEGMLLIHEVWLKTATGRGYVDAIPDVEKNLSTISGLSSDQNTLLYSLVNTWLGTGLVFAKEPDYDRAENLFTAVISSLEVFPIDQRLEWFRDVTASLAYRQRAYMRRIRGAFQDAIEDFRRGLRFSRSIDFYHEEATLRNDLGFAQMLAGVFQSAFENMWDGLQLRYKVAIGHRIALSYSSLAQYSIYIGSYEEGRKYAQFAIRIASAVGFRRGLGFGNLALAESTRRYAFSIHGPANQAGYLTQAQDAIDVACYLLSQIGEQARVIEANLEQACLYRDRLRIETDASKKRTWFEKSNEQFQYVAKTAEEAGIHYRQVDAMCNRIWLGYLADNIEHAEQAAREFELLEVLKPYWFENGKFADEVQARKNPILWSQIGKYHVGLGMIAFKKWKNTEKEIFLQEAARHIMLGMTYTTAFAEDHRGFREARRTIYQSLARLNSEELRQFSNHVLDAEVAENIPNRPSSLQMLMRDHALWFID